MEAETEQERGRRRHRRTLFGVENTRAVVLSWPAVVRRAFADELRRHLESQTDIPLTQMTSLTMARVLPRPGLERVR